MRPNHLKQGLGAVAGLVAADADREVIACEGSLSRYATNAIEEYANLEKTRQTHQIGSNANR